MAKKATKKVTKKAIKKTTKKDIEELLTRMIREMNFEYFGVDVEYSYSHNCNEDSCDMICRCGKISDIRVSVDEIKVIEYLMEKITGVFKRCNVFYDNITEYCIERLLKNYNLSNPSLYDVDYGNGYYGEEIKGVFINIYEELVKDIYSIIYDKPINSVKFVLEKEYGHLIDVVKNSNDCWIEEVYIKDLIISNPDHYVKLNKKIIDIYKNYKLPIGIYVKSDNKYRIIDGYHRYKANVDKEMCKIIVIE